MSLFIADANLAPNLQVWNNAAFDSSSSSGNVEDQLPLRQISMNRIDDFDPSKENKGKSFHDLLDVEKINIDAEIEAIEKEIGRLSARLEFLSAKKLEKELKKKGRIVPAKFMTPVKTPAAKKVEEITPARRRGVSLGPREIFAESEKKDKILITTPKPWPSVVKSNAIITPGLNMNKVVETPKSRTFRRGISLGPSEIAAAAAISTCLKNRETAEKAKAANKEKVRGLSSSTKPRRSTTTIAAASVSDQRKGMATVGMKSVKRGEEEALKSIKPKALFQEENKAPAQQAKRPAKNAKSRIVASRYSLAPSHSLQDEQSNKRRKWSLPEIGKDKATVAKIKDSISIDVTLKEHVEQETEMKSNVEQSPPSILRIAANLTKIKELRWNAFSPRDSGCAKRVAELAGRKSHFAIDDLVSSSQSLDFEEED